MHYLFPLVNNLYRFTEKNNTFNKMIINYTRDIINYTNITNNYYIIKDLPRLLYSNTT